MPDIPPSRHQDDIITHHRPHVIVYIAQDSEDSDQDHEETLPFTPYRFMIFLYKVFTLVGITEYMLIMMGCQLVSVPKECPLQPRVMLETFVLMWMIPPCVFAGLKLIGKYERETQARLPSSHPLESLL